MISLTTATDLRDVISITDATITGILIAIVIVLGWVVRYLFNANQKLYGEFIQKNESLHKEFIVELKANNETLLRVNNSQNEFVKDMIELRKMQ